MGCGVSLTSEGVSLATIDGIADGFVGVREISIFIDP
jgi:hypothetical protein